MYKYLALLLILTISLNPIYGQTKEDKKAAKEEKAQLDYENMKELINSREFEFIGDWGTSSTGVRVDLMSNPTFLKMNGDEADGYFPFFGRGFAGAAYPSGGSSGIEFKNPLNDYTVSYNDKKKFISIKFTAKGGNDTYTVTMKVFGSGSTTVNINSNNRSPMSYSGKTKVLKKEKKE